MWWFSKGTCSDCKFSQPTTANQVQCHRNPPQVLERVFVESSPTITSLQEWGSAFPTVLPDWTCGEFKRK